MSQVMPDRRRSGRELMKETALFKNWGTFGKGMDAKSLQLSFANHIEYSLSKDKYTATMRDLYHSLALTTRDRMVERWIRTQQTYYDEDVKRVYYLSAEYLLGRALVTNLLNLGAFAETAKAMAGLGLDLEEISEEEPDAGLGNGGLGRLAACFMDSLATLEIPAYGYGIRYEFGIFEQIIRHLGQVELPDAWLKYGNPWELPRPEYTFTVHFYGHPEEIVLPDGHLKTEWVNTSDVIGVAHDVPIVGYDNNTVNTLRLWSSRASHEFDLNYFQHGDYLKAVEEKNVSENISKVLYPNDNIYQGQELRLKQQYFFVSCSIQDIIRRYQVKHDGFDSFPDKVAIQMNDTHPSLAILELMRIFLDDYQMDWEKAWDITTRSCAYTNHTLLAEALEKWPVAMFGTLLPRHLKIAYEINRRFLRDVSVRWVGDNDRMRRMSLIEEEPDKKLRMAHLAFIGSHSVNGVAELHTRLLKERVFKDFHEMFPGRINNKTNGVTPRRWLSAANPGLARLITDRIGSGWVKDLAELKKLEAFVKDSEFLEQFNAVKRKNKERLAQISESLTGFPLDPDSIFDVQVKRIHEYKRQLLNILYVIHSWLRLKHDPAADVFPRSFIFGGKAAPSYVAAKTMIKLVCHLAEMINRDASTNQKIKVVFLPNYRVTLAEKIIPAADVSEQISTAGYEASGTGNMKFALNGALTVGTLDGANIEIMEEVGKENIFIFGLNAEEVSALRPGYRPSEYCAGDPLLQEALDLIRRGFLSPESPDLFQPLVDALLSSDPYMVLADFASFCQCQQKVDQEYRQRSRWAKKAVLNVARMGKFSSDRTILEYNRDIWKAQPLPIVKNADQK